jgi:hypothetical protein
VLLQCGRVSGGSAQTSIADEMAASKKQGGEQKQGRPHGHFKNSIPRLCQERLFSEGPAFARRANAQPKEHAPGLPRKTVSYNANDKP